MKLAHSLPSTARTLLSALLLALALPLCGAELRAQGAAMTIGLTAADREELAAHLLTMDDMRKLAAVSKKFAELAQRDSKVCAFIQQKKAEATDSPDEWSIAERAKALEAEPVTRAALQESGVTARGYVVTLLTYIATTLDSIAKATGRALYDDPVEVHPANHQFLISHQREIGELFQSIQDPCQ